jgi:hypothetical protein
MCPRAAAAILVVMLPLRKAYPLVACGGTAVAAVAFLSAHIGATGWRDVPIAVAPALGAGVALDVALVSAGVAGLALVAGLRATGAPAGRWPGRLLTAWAAATALLGTVPADTPRLVTGALSVVILFALPAATALLVPLLRQDERWAGTARPMEWLALAQGLGLAAITYVALPGHQVMIGLAERLLLGVELAAAGVLAVRLVRLTWAVRVRLPERVRVPLVGRG